MLLPLFPNIIGYRHIVMQTSCVIPFQMAFLILPSPFADKFTNFVQVIKIKIIKLLFYYSVTPSLDLITQDRLSSWFWTPLCSKNSVLKYLVDHLWLITHLCFPLRCFAKLHWFSQVYYQIFPHVFPKYTLSYRWQTEDSSPLSR